MATPQVTAVAQAALPAAAGGVTITPSGTSWANSGWTELRAASGPAITIVGVVFNPGSGDSFEIDIGKGAAGSETVVSTTGGRVVSTANAASWCLATFEIAVDNIAANDRVAVRMRKFGTSVTNWTGFKLLYYSTVTADVGVTANPTLVVPSAADGVAVTPNASAWVNSSWVQLSASLADIAILGVIYDGTGPELGEWEVDIGTGAVSAEVVVGTTGGVIDATLAGINPVFPFRIPIVLVGSNRVAIRMRKSGTDTTNWTFKLLYVSTSGFGTSAVQYTTQPQRRLPDAATLATVVPSGTAWANSPWLQLSTGLSAAIVVVAGLISTGYLVELEVEVGKGAVGSETVVSTSADVRDGSAGADECIPHFVPVDNIAGSTRIAMRLRKSGTSTTATGLGLVYNEKAL